MGAAALEVVAHAGEASAVARMADLEEVGIVHPQDHQDRREDPLSSGADLDTVDTADMEAVAAAVAAPALFGQYQVLSFC